MDNCVNVVTTSWSTYFLVIIAKLVVYNSITYNSNFRTALGNAAAAAYNYNNYYYYVVVRPTGSCTLCRILGKIGTSYLKPLYIVTPRGRRVGRVVRHRK